MVTEVPLGSLVTIQRGTTYKSALLGQPGPVLLGLASIARNGGFRADSLRTYGGDSPENLLVKPGELYASLKDVTQSGDLLGSVARVPNDGPIGRLTQDTVRLDVISEQIAPEYLYWALLTPSYRAYCRSHATGTTNLGLPREDFFAYPVRLPGLPEQRRIAGVLGALDDLIDTNREIAANSSALWRALVRVALEDATESLPLSDLAQFVNGKNFTKDASGYGRPVIRTPEVRRGPEPGTVRSDVQAANEHVAREGDILFVWSGSLVVGRWLWEDGLINQHVFKVLPKPGVPDWLIFAMIEYQMPWFRSLAADKATTMGHIKREHLDAAVPMPSAAEIKRLGDVIEPIWNEALQCGVAIQELARTRDELLPLLLSGRVRVEEVAV
jgi:type I restriction enzyme, S subunit